MRVRTREASVSEIGTLEGYLRLFEMIGFCMYTYERGLSHEVDVVVARGTCLRTGPSATRPSV